MKEKLRNLFDEMKVRSRYKSMNAIIDMIEPLINQEVEKRIAERMPSVEVDDDEIPYSPKPSLFKFHQKIGFIRGWRAAMIKARSRLTNQKTEGEENG